MCEQVLRLNSHITADGLPIINQNCIKEGIRYMNDLVNENGKLFQWDDFGDKHVIDTWVDFFGIYKSLPVERLDCINRDLNGKID